MLSKMKEAVLNSWFSFVKRHPLVTFFILAYALAWILIPLVVSVSLFFGLLALFVPTFAALVVTAITDGKAGVKNLLRRVVLWRVGFKWYVVAIGLPILLGLIAMGLNTLLTGEAMAIDVQQPLTLTLILAILVLGEEIGWRGFALPRLQTRYNSLVASLILGVLWAACHLPNALIPGLAHYFYAFPAFLIYVVGMTILFTWLSNNTHMSVLLAWIFHAAINIAGAYLFIGEITRQWWLNAAVYMVTALIVIALTTINLGRKTTTHVAPSSTEQPAVG